MARQKKVEEKAVEETVVPEPVAQVEAPDSPAKKEFRAFIERYKAQSPQKYELKKEELLKKLKSL